MRRPHRSIETFDISLMAVVTKAMGAFLVLMLLLMPYYSSGPIGQKAASDLAEKVEQADKKIREVIEKLNTASYEDLRKLLDEALQLLDDARRLVAELKRANDALQAQVKRLEERVTALQDRITSLEARAAQLQDENASLRARVDPLERENQQLKEELNKHKGLRINAVLVALDCSEQVSLEVYDPQGVLSLADGRKWPYKLNFSGSHRELATARNFSLFASGQLSPGTVYMVGRVEKRDARVETMKNGLRGTKLKSASADCELQVGITIHIDSKVSSYNLQKRTLRKGEYASLLGELAVKNDDVDWVDTSQAAADWMTDQLRHAEKED